MDSTTSDSWAHDGRKFRTIRFAKEIDEKIKALNRLDNWHAPLGYLRDVAVIAAAVVLCVRLSWWSYPVALVLIGSRQRAFSNLLHESAHGMLAANRRLNLVLGTVLSAYPIFQTHYGYKRAHVATHHPKLGDPEQDPDLKYFIEEGVYRPGTKRQLVLRMIILPAIGSKVVSHLYFLFRDRIRRLGSTGAEQEVLNEYWSVRTRRDKRAFLVFWAAVAGVVTTTGTVAEFVLFWLVPYLTAFQIIGWYIELSEHTPAVKFTNVDLYMTRNRKSRGLERFLTGTYADHHHLDHHLDPRTPYWNLEAAHRIRLADPRYAEVDRSFGGLFTRGPQAQPSALSDIVRRLAEYHSAKRSTGSAAVREAV